MKLIILKENLKTGLSVVERAITENSNLPILKNVLIKTFNNKIKFSSTNLELAIEKLTSGKIIEEGGITVPFSAFYTIVSNSDSERINLESENNTLIVKTDNYHAKIQGIKEEDFPIIPKISNQTQNIEISSSLLKEAFSVIAPAAQISEIRPEISGVLLDFQTTVLKLVATDSFRLAEKTLFDSQFKTGFKKGFKAVIPLKTIQEILRSFPSDKETIIQIDPSQILFKTEDQELISRLIDGQYPDYEQIVPKNIETELVLNREKFAAAVRLVSSLTGKVNDIKIRLKEGTKALEIYAANQYVGENNYLIPVKIKGHNFKEVSFNWRYLTDGLKTISSEEIFFGLNGDTKPAILRSTDDTSYFYILMPIKSV